MFSAAGLLAAGALALIAASPSPALERSTARIAGAERSDRWRSSSDCTVAYYNFCTGWVWIWSRWERESRVGVDFESCGENVGGLLFASWILTWTGAPSGYGYTGSIGVFPSDANGCPAGAPIGSQPYLPQSGWNGYGWGWLNVPPRFVVAATLGSAPSPPITYVSDHPGAGPTGPIACGTCYPTTRVTRSFHYGNPASPLCPGSPLFDGACDVELFFDVQMTVPTAVRGASWGALKALYR